MSDKDQAENDIARLKRLNEELGRSLERCRALLHDYEAKLAANSNERASANDEDETRKA